MSQPSTIPQKLMTAALLHFTQGVPIDDCDIRPEQRKRLARVSHVYWLWKQNPFLDYFGLLKNLVKGKYASPQNEWIAANADKRLFEFVIEQATPSNRRVQEERVRASANHLMKIGMETDNAFAIADGAKIAMRLDRLDQPENEQADMTRAMFLPPVVVTDISKIDESKQNIDDPEMKRIMSKYGGVQDEKMRDMDEMVEIIEAKAQANQQASLINGEEE